MFPTGQAQSAQPQRNVTWALQLPEEALTMLRLTSRRENRSIGGNCFRGVQLFLRWNLIIFLHGTFHNNYITSGTGMPRIINVLAIAWRAAATKRKRKFRIPGSVLSTGHLA